MHLFSLSSAKDKRILYEEEQYKEQIAAEFYLHKAELRCEAFDLKNDWLSAGICSVQGWRINQEDAHLCDLNFDPVNQMALFGVFDGHNGPEVSRYAAQTLPQMIKNSPYYKNKEYGKALDEVFMQFDASLLDEKVNKELQIISRQYESQYGPIKRRQNSPLLAQIIGSTAVVALLSKQTGKLYVANIGDSRCGVCNKNKPHSMTRDHKPTDRDEKKRIELAGSQVINGRIDSGLNLSRAFGDYMLKANHDIGPNEQALIAVPDLTVSKHKFRVGDFIILACDGIWNCLDLDEVCSVIRKHLKSKKAKKLSRICQEVMSKCISPVRPIDGQKGGDNMTCMIIRIEEDLPHD